LNEPRRCLYFATGKAVLKPEADRALEQVAQPARASVASAQ
jgi:hypothetical protein